MENNDLSNIEKLFKEHYSALINYACTYVYNKVIADDIIQDVFLQMWINRDRIDFETDYISSYLYKSVRNTSLNYIQKLKKNAFLGLDEVDSMIQKAVVSEIGSPYEDLQAQELSNHIKICVDALPPQCKTVFKYKRVQQLKNKEIAELLNISEKAVEKHVTKALSCIRQYLQQEKLLIFIILFFTSLK